MLTNRLYKGVDTIRRVHNGGTACFRFIPFWWKLIDTLLSTYIAKLEIDCWTRDKIIDERLHKQNIPIRTRKTIIILLILLIMSLSFELVYKFQTYSLVFIINPCHLAAFLQAFLLINDLRMSRKHSRTHKYRQFYQILYGAHFALLSGAFVAVLFPETSSRLTNFQFSNYFIEHFLVLLIPVFLQRSKPWLYKVPRINYFGAKIDGIVVLGTGLVRLYYFWVLQPISLASGININNIMCPAPSDPFRFTPLYRFVGNMYLTAFVFVLIPVYSTITHQFNK